MCSDHRYMSEIDSACNGRRPSRFWVPPTLGQHGCEIEEELIRDRLVQSKAGVHTSQGLTEKLW
jgi:hypothetical protein